MNKEIRKKEGQDDRTTGQQDDRTTGGQKDRRTEGQCSEFGESNILPGFAYPHLIPPYGRILNTPGLFLTTDRCWF